MRRFRSNWRIWVWWVSILSQQWKLCQSTNYRNKCRLIAVLLGRFRLSTAKAIETFNYILKYGFTKPASTLRRSWALFKGGGLFSNKELRALFEALESQHFGGCNIQFQEESTEERSRWFVFHLIDWYIREANFFR